MKEINTFQNTDKLVIIDGRVEKEKLSYFKEKAYTIIPTIKCNEVQDPISYHPDIVLTPIGEKTLIVAPNVFDYYYEKLSGFGFNLIKGNSFLEKNYPKDSFYNLANTGSYILHRKDITDRKILEQIDNKKYKFINIKQGYSKCSIGIISKDRIITSDKGIYKTIKSRTSSLDVLLIEEGYIDLEGFDYGFIGGAMGLEDRDRVLLAGSLDYHKDGSRIREYIRRSGKKPIELWDGRLRDIGSIFCFKL